MPSSTSDEISTPFGEFAETFFPLVERRLIRAVKAILGSLSTSVDGSFGEVV